MTTFPDKILLNLPSKTYLLFSLLLGMAFSSPAANLIDIQVGRHGDYSLLIVTCNLDLQYKVYDEGRSVRIAFPAGTGSTIVPSVFEQIKDDFFQSVAYYSVKSELLIRASSPYRLRYYNNNRPFQLVMDFTILPPESAKKIEKSPPPPVIAEKNPEVRSPAAKPPPSKEKPSSTPPDTVKIPVDTVKTTDPYELGLQLKSQGDFPGALQAFLEAVPQRNENALYQAALIYEELNQREKAIETLLEVVNQSPSWLEPRVKLALLYKLAGNDNQAEKIWLQVLSAVEIDTSIDLNKFAAQIVSLEKMVQEKGQKLDDAFPEIDKKYLPDLPYVPILIVVGIVVIVIAVRLLSNWRMNRILASVMDGTEYLDSAGGMDEVSPRGKTKADDFSDLIEDRTPPVKTPEPPKPAASPDEKQQMIYNLLDQNYSVSEIAKMLDMGQEEVKFIIDFRTKDEV